MVIYNELFIDIKTFYQCFYYITKLITAEIYKLLFTDCIFILIKIINKISIHRNFLINTIVLFIIRSI